MISYYNYQKEVKMQNNWQTWVIAIGGIVAIVGQFWGGAEPNYYLPLIGGVLALIGAVSN